MFVYWRSHCLTNQLTKDIWRVFLFSLQTITSQTNLYLFPIMEKLLTVEQILKYVDSFSKRSCLTEAEEILSSNLVMCGLESKKDDRVQIEAICLPSDSVKKHSYVVNCSLFKNEDEWTIQSVHCTCNSKSCKHCIAVLLYCNRLLIFCLFGSDVISSRKPSSWIF